VAGHTAFVFHVLSLPDMEIADIETMHPELRMKREPFQESYYMHRSL